MAEKRMLIVDADVAKKIEENRGDMPIAEFLSFLIDSRLNGDRSNLQDHREYIDREEFRQFAQGMKELLRNFLEFFISYGMELGKEPQGQDYDELSRKLQELSNSKAAKS